MTHVVRRNESNRTNQPGHPGRPTVAFLIVLITAAASLLAAIPSSATTSHAPIFVNGDADLAQQATANGWPGSGTATDPYRLSGLHVLATSANAIHITNTAAHLVISDNLIDGAGSPYFGVYLTGVRNAQVEGNTLRDVAIGIFVSSVRTTTIVDNTVSRAPYGIAVVSTTESTIAANRVDNSSIGIQLLTSWENAVHDNLVLDATFRGYYQHRGWGNDVAGNTLDGASSKGAYLLTTNGNVLRDNTIRRATTGVHLTPDADGNRLVNNTFTANRNGLLLDAVEGTEVVGGLFEAQTEAGIRLQNAPANHINGTTFRANPTGIHLFDSDGNVVSGARFENNTVGLFAFLSDQNTFQANDLHGHLDAGILLRSSGGNHVLHNHAEDNQHAVRLESTANNRIAGNTLLGNGVALLLSLGNKNEVSGNQLADNDLGLRVAGSRENVIVNNAFDNPNNVLVTGNVVNTWSRAPVAGTNIVGGPWIAGNWWNDYTGADLNGDGIGELRHGPFPSSSSAGATLAAAAGLAHGPDDEYPLTLRILSQDLVDL